VRLSITGGAGFIGINAAARYLQQGHQVSIIDDMSRAKVGANLDWLKSFEYARGLRVHVVDVRERSAIEGCLAEEHPDLLLHLAAQVAVTTSVTDPRHDFEVNALGTFNVLEAARSLINPPVVIYASTNKVYGKLAGVATTMAGNRYTYQDQPGGVSESAPLDFYSPYGCSKGAADQYVLDYARIYGLRTVAMRQSCIYGTHQFGVEDQGWVAWFSIAALSGKPITIYGDGKQVRDLLWVEDLLNLYDAAYEHIDEVSGQAFNVGGGAAFSLSLVESLEIIGKHLGHEVPVAYSDWRPGDQPVFIADTSRAKSVLGWQPRVSPDEGIARLIAWLKENRKLLD
jgi:CDP-paratose 2-epimerase